MQPDTHSSAWLSKKLKSVNILREGPLYFTNNNDWEFVIEPLLTKNQASTLFRREKELQKKRGTRIITENGLKIIKTFFGEEAVNETIKNLPIKTISPIQENNVSWIRCCNQAFEETKDNPAIQKWSQQDWQAQEASAFLLQVCASEVQNLEALTKEEAYNLIDHLNEENPHNSEEEKQVHLQKMIIENAKTLSMIITSLLEKLPETEQATILFNDKISELWINAIAETIRHSCFIAMAGKPLPLNTPFFWLATEKTQELNHQWSQESPESYKTLQDNQERIWKNLSTHNEPESTPVTRFSPAEAYKLENIIRRNKHTEYNEILNSWKNNPELVETRNQLIGIYEGADSRPTGVWNKNHLYSFASNHYSITESLKPNENLSAPQAHDNLTKEDATEKMRQSMQLFGKEVTCKPDKITDNESWVMEEKTRVTFPPEEETSPEWEQQIREKIRKIEKAEIHDLVASASQDIKLVKKHMEVQKYRTPKGYTNGFKNIWSTLGPSVMQNLIMAITPLNIRDMLSLQFKTALTKGCAISQGLTAALFHLESWKTPTYFLPKEMWNAANATKLPDDLEIETIEFPAPAMIVNLENGCLKTKNILFETLMINVIQEEIVICEIPGIPYIPIKPIKGEPRIVVNLIGKNKNGEVVHCVSDNNLRQTLGEIGKANANEEILRIAEEEGLLQTYGLGETKYSELQNISRMLPGIAIRLLLLMVARPDLVEKNENIAQSETPDTKQGNKHNQVGLREPLYIGRHFRIKTENQTGNEAKETGTSGRSPEVHFREGHLRNQPHGPQNSLRKIKWIEPTIVGLGNRNHQK